MTTTLTTGTGRRAQPDALKPARHWHLGQLNWLGGTFGWLWLVVVMLPIYWIVVTSFKDQSAYFTQNPFALPSAPTWANYKLVIESDFPRYFLNSVIVSVCVVVLSTVLSCLAGYAFGTMEFRGSNVLFYLLLLGLMVPSEAVPTAPPRLRSMLVRPEAAAASAGAMPAVVMAVIGVRTSAWPMARTIFGIQNWSPALLAESVMFMKQLIAKIEMPRKPM